MKYITLLVCFLFFATLNAVWQLDESFESGTIPAQWTIYDTDGDGSEWRTYNNVSYSHTGTWTAFVDNYLPNQNDDWLITPQIQISNGDSLYFWTRSWYGVENLEVKVSTTGQAIGNFNTTVFTSSSINSTYQLIGLSLDAFAGQNVYLGFHWECENYGILLDDIKVGNSTNLIPVMELPETIQLEQDSSLDLDFASYIINATPANSVLTVSGNSNVSILINGFIVQFSAQTWTGTEDVTFTLTQGTNIATDFIQVTVTTPPVTEIEVLEIISPDFPVYTNQDVLPSLEFLNIGNATITEGFSIECVIRDDQAIEVYNQSETYTNEVAPMESVQYVFPTIWSPVLAGDYNVQFLIDYPDADQSNNELSVEFSVMDHLSTGGPDAFGYQWIDSEDENGPEFNWIDISTTGTGAIMQGVDSFHGDDNIVEAIQIGFEFPFYGQSYSELFADTNGEILFCDNNWFEPFPSNGWDSDGNVFNWMYPIPGYTQMPGLIAVYWDDLEADQGIGDIYYQSFGTEPERYCVIQWNNFRFHSGTGLENYLNFEVILHESGEIVMQYLNTSTGQTGTNAPHAYGQSSTVAIQNSTAEMGLCYLRELVQGSTWVGVTPEGNMLHDNLAISFYAATDDIVPFISFEEMGNTFELNPQIEVSITDMSSITEAVLMYNTGNGWESCTPVDSGDGMYTYSPGPFTQGTEISFYFQATDEFNNSAILPIDAPQECYRVMILPGDDTELLLAYPGGQDYQSIELPVYLTILNDLTVPYDLYNWQEYPDFDIPDEYKAVVCYANSGSYSTSVDTLSNALMDYMDRGTGANPHGVLLNSDGWAYSQSGHSNDYPMKKLLNAYFRTDYIGTTIGGGSNGLGGPDNLNYENGTFTVLDNSPIGTPGMEISVYANSPDCIFENDACPDWYADEVQNPEIGSHNAFCFEDGPFNGQAYLYHGVCATWIDNQIYKGFYFSFDLSQIINSENRQQILQDALVWFDVIEPQEIDNNQAQIHQKMLTNYPNPFNPETSISYWVDNESSKTELIIYNVKGQKVTKLVDEIQKAGKHVVKWNGKDAGNKSLSSGVYFCRHKSGGRTETKKILLLK